MTELRKKFEELAYKNKWNICKYPKSDHHTKEGEYCDDFVNGAWYAFQEQQKRIDEHNRKLNIFIDELRKTHSGDKDNKIDFWRGFSECADSSIQVFLRDVGFID